MGYVPGQIETYRQAEVSCRDVSLCLVAGKPTGTMGYVPRQMWMYMLCITLSLDKKTDRDHGLCPQADRWLKHVVHHFVSRQENRQGPWVMSPGR